MILNERAKPSFTPSPAAVANLAVLSYTYVNYLS